MKIECPYCAGHYDVDPQYIGQTIKCPDCERDFEVVNPNLAPCPDCFVRISKRAQFCPHCGAVLKSSSPANTMPSSSNSRSSAGEREIMVCHPSAMNSLWVIIIGILTIPFVIGIFILLFVWIEIHFTSYKITTMRIIVRRGWISKLQNEIWIKDMRGANLVQGVWQRIIGVGDISIGTAATAGTEICMAGIAQPQNIVDLINSLRQG